LTPQQSITASKYPLSNPLVFRRAVCDPEDDVGTMMVIGWQPMTATEWEAQYCTPPVRG
jgi:hypothetical protein